MAQSATTSSGQPNVQESTQESRAAALWRNKRLEDEIDSQMAKDMAAQVNAVTEAKDRLKALQANLTDAVPRHPRYSELVEARNQQTILKAQLAANYKPADDKTIKLHTGDKVQFRASSGLTILDHKAVAQALLEKDLWEAAGVQISVNEKMLIPLVENGVLKGAAKVEEKVIVAMSASKE